MPTEMSPRKFERIEYLTAVCENSYFKPKVSLYQKIISVFNFGNIDLVVKLIKQ